MQLVVEHPKTFKPQAALSQCLKLLGHLLHGGCDHLRIHFQQLHLKRFEFRQSSLDRNLRKSMCETVATEVEEINQILGLRELGFV